MVKIEGSPGYLIFFDNVRIDPYVKSFSSTVSCDGSIGRANIEMIYMPEFDRINTGSGEIVFQEEAIEDMTNVKIFIKNIFNGKYSIVFDGNIRSKSVTDSPNGYSLNYGALDHIESLTKTIAPLAIPLEDKQLGDKISQDAFRLSSQGIDYTQIDALPDTRQLNFKGKNIEDVVGIVKKQALLVNRIFSDKGGVMYWNGASERISVMGDINENLVKAEILDFVINPNVLSVDNMYVLINSLVQKLMFEFYQDKDGSIRVKPPYWNEKILMNHIIDDSLIMSSSFNSSWESMYSRVITTGSMDQVYQQNISSTYGRGMFTPMGTFVGELNSQGKWADSKGSTATAENTSNKWGTNFSTNQTGVDWLDRYKVTKNWSLDERGCEWSTPSGAPVKHIGKKAKVVARDRHEDFGSTVTVRILDGAYAGFEIMYTRLSRSTVSVGQIVDNGTGIGHTSENLRIEVWTENYGISEKYGDDFSSIETVDPIVYCRDISTNTSTPTMFAIESMDVSSLLSPSDFERKHGVSVLDTTQPLIKFSNTESAFGTDAYTALKKYSAFMFDMLNSMAHTATVQLIGAPWIRPGFNSWISPLKHDKVYYVTSVTHSGDPQNGTFTTLRLAHGRDSKAFFLGNESVFGIMKAQKDNIFINEVKKEWLPENAFGPVINNVESYLNLKQRIKDFHTNFGSGIMKANKAPLLTYLYGSPGKVNFGYEEFTAETFKKSPFSSYAGGRLTGIDFSNDMTPKQVQSVLNFMYEKAPAVVRTRASKTKVVFDMAKKRPRDKKYDYTKYASDPIIYDNSTFNYTSVDNNSTDTIDIKTELKLETLNFGWPSKPQGTITSVFSHARKSPVDGVVRPHTGVDIARPHGSNIIASEAGRVMSVGYDSVSGNYIKLDHGNGITTFCGHASSIIAKRGQRVEKGEVIAKVGSTGRSTGAHIHFELRLNGVAVDPAKYIS